MCITSHNIKNGNDILEVLNIERKGERRGRERERERERMDGGSDGDKITVNYYYYYYYFLSDEDTDVKAIVKAWLRSSSSSSSSPLSPHLEGWIEDYFYQGLDWILKTAESVVETTLVGLVMNGLSHLVGVTSKGEFSCALVRGLGGNLTSTTRTEFAKQVSKTQLLMQ